MDPVDADDKLLYLIACYLNRDSKAFQTASVDYGVHTLIKDSIPKRVLRDELRAIIPGCVPNVLFCEYMSQSRSAQ